MLTFRPTNQFYTFNNHLTAQNVCQRALGFFHHHTVHTDPKSVSQSINAVPKPPFLQAGVPRPQRALSPWERTRSKARKIVLSVGTPGPEPRYSSLVRLIPSRLTVALLLLLKKKCSNELMNLVKGPAAKLKKAHRHRRRKEVWDGGGGKTTGGLGTEVPQRSPDASFPRN